MKILVVDDILFIRKLICDKLKKLGYEVYEATNGKEAVTIASEHQPELIFMDIVMPKMDGIAATKEIKSFLKCKIVMCSVVSDKTKIQEAIQAGADKYILKPLNDERMAEIIEKEVENIIGAESIPVNNNSDQNT